MREYHKIQSIFKRNEKTHKFIEGDFSLPEIEYLQNNLWNFTEKIDGTNVRVLWDGNGVILGGRTKDAQMPTFLLTKLQELFPVTLFREIYPDTPMCLYGEGYGARIQKGGGNYISNGVDFVLFDVLINDYWLRWGDIEDVASRLNIKTVPIMGCGTIADAIKIVTSGLDSTFGKFTAEGLVLKPAVDLYSRMGHRVVTKLKHKDFAR